MGAFSNQVYATISERFYDTHHQERSQTAHNSIIWINNLTNESCDIASIKNPCEVCRELMEFGWEAMNEPHTLKEEGTNPIGSFKWEEAS